ncbi:nucleotidyl transferase AbiEii/AbiGii toxin family protein [Mycoplasma sp. AC157]
MSNKLIKNYSDSVKNKVKHINNKYKLPPNTALNTFFMLEFLKLVAESKYNKEFVVKGGMLLLNQLGLDKRWTKDIDFLSLNSDINLVESKIKEIIRNNSQIKFQVLPKTENIREQELYGGIRIYLKASLNKIETFFHIDITIKDVIYPEIVNNVYNTLEKQPFKLQEFPLETVFAEKLHSLYELGVNTSRFKDFFDFNFLINNVEINSLKQVINLVFNHRKTIFNINTMINTILKVKNSNNIQKLWDIYKINIKRDLKLEEILNKLQELLQRIFNE